MTYLPDVNVWIAFAVGGHIHHPAAKDWFDKNGSDQMAFCRITEMGLFRLLTNARVMEGNALSAAEAWSVRDRFREDTCTGFVAEPAGFEEHWRRTSRAGNVGPNFWTDAYLIGLCASTDCTLITFDRALAGKKGCKVHLLNG